MHISSRFDRFLLNAIKASLLLILFLPLFVYEQFLFPFVFPRTIVFRVLIEFSTVAWIILAIRNPFYRFRMQWLTGALLIFLTILTVTAFTGVSPYHSFWSTIERSEGILTWIHLTLYFILLSQCIHTKDEWFEFFRTAAVAGALQTIYALGEFFQLGFALETAGARVSGAIGNPSFLGPYLMAMVALQALLFAEAKRRWQRALYAVLILSDLFLIWQTQTRGAIIGTLVGIVIAIIVYMRQQWSRKALYVTVALMLIIAASGALFLRASAQSTWLLRYPTLQRLATISTNDITTQNRMIVWGVGLQALLARPLLGWGLENFAIPFNIYFDPAITRDIGSHPWYDRAHNTVVEIGVASGALGLASYIGVWVVSLWFIYRKRSALTSIERSSIAGFLIAYFIQNLFVFDTINSYMIWLFLLAYVQFRAIGPRLVPSRDTFSQRRLLPAVALALIILVPCLYYFNVRPILANHYAVDAAVHQKQRPDQGLAQFKNVFTYSPPAEEEYRFILVQYTRDQINLRGLTTETVPLLEFAISEMEKTIAARPLAVQNDLLLAELYLAASNPLNDYLGRAEGIALQALGKAPRRYQTYTLLGRIKMSQGDAVKAIDYLQQAIQLNENFAETHWNLAIAYILSRQADRSAEPLARATQLGFPVYDQKNVEKLLGAYRDSQDLKATIAFLEKLHTDYPDNEIYTRLLDELTAFYNEAIQTISEQSNGN